MNKHDASYRQLFSNPQLVRSLFEGIINEPWLNLLDWHSLQPLPTDFVTDQLRQRQGDLAWRIRRRDGENLYVLLMLEHQSVSDYMMALRVAVYCCLLYESLVRRKLLRRHARLPLVLPVVLYSGVKAWTAPLSTTELIDPAPATLQSYTLQMRYLLINEGVLVRAGQLPEYNLAALLFRLEHNRGIAEVQQLMQTIFDCTQGPEHTELRRAFVSWTRHVLLPRALPNVAVPGADDLLEIKDMISEHSRSWTHQWKMEGLAEGRKQGLQEGRQEGRQKGLQEGEGVILRRQLTRKFGPLSATIEQRLKDASSAQLETWSLNILDATSLEAVFSE